MNKKLIWWKSAERYYWKMAAIKSRYIIDG